MKSKSYTFIDDNGKTLLTNSRRVSFTDGHKPAVAFGSESEVASTKDLWERQTGRTLTAIPAGEVEYHNA